MGFITPDKIVSKAEKAYPLFLLQWIRGAETGFFPYRVRLRFSVDPKDSKGTIHASERLQAKSKAERGWGYSVRREPVRLRDFGNNPIPTAITIETLVDLLRLAKREDDFRATRLVVEQVRSSLPQLHDWLIRNVQTLHKLAEPIDGLLRVTQFFLNNPWPNCYARQIPVFVDTKFIQRHAPILRQWLDLLLPASAIDVNETTFVRRFGLRDGQPHRAIRLLDAQLRAELRLPYDELSLPLQSIARFALRDATVIIVENDLNLLTLPPVPRAIGIRGEGYSVNRLEKLGWLHMNRLLYWGDIDVDGFLILSQLRNLFPHVESIMMDQDTLLQHNAYCVDGNGTSPAAPTNLTTAEVAVFTFCSDNNRRLEQEKLLQSFVNHTFATRRER
jgi:hypothetical protein